MTTGGHILPGYCDYPADRPSISQMDFRRVKTAYAGRTLLSDEEKKKLYAPMDTETLENIREKAKNTWLLKDREPTTYGHHFNDEKYKGHPPSLIRPTSPSRRNKPHPQQ